MEEIWSLAEREREAPAVWSDDYFKIPLGETK